MISSSPAQAPPEDSLAANLTCQYLKQNHSTHWDMFYYAIPTGNMSGSAKQTGDSLVITVDILHRRVVDTCTEEP